MIDLLLDTIVETLQTELIGIIDPERFSRAPLAAANLSLPAIALYPQKLTLTPEPQQTLDPNQSHREFQQAFCIEIASAEANEAEKIMSLVLGILTLSQSQLLQPFQQSPESEEDHTYTSAQFGTRHRLRQLQFLSAQPDYSENRHQWYIQAMASGHLSIGRLEPQSQDQLTKVTVESHWPQVKSPEVSTITGP